MNQSLVFQHKMIKLLDELNSENRSSMRGDVIALQFSQTIDEFKKSQRESITLQEIGH